MFDIILYQPEIPPNTGNVIRLAANNGFGLHLVKPLGFRMDDRDLRRAGLDYHEYATVKVHENWAACLEHFAGCRLFAASTKGATRYSDVAYKAGDVFILARKRGDYRRKFWKHSRPSNAYACPCSLNAAA
jgi:tRNA (cytidine/uridine-2'-O-)-methyltransferase